MFELPVTAFCCDQIPPIFTELGDYFANFHLVILSQS